MKSKDVLNSRAFYHKQDSGMIFFAAILLPQILGLIVSTIALSFYHDAASASTSIGYIIPVMLCSSIGFLITFFIYQKVTKVDYKRAAKLDFKIGTKNALICVLIGIVGLLGLNLLITAFDGLYALLGYKAGGIGLPLSNFGWFVLNVILLAVLPAITEELIFRGVVLNGFVNSLGKTKAIILTSLLFALMHGNLAQLIYPFLLGIILSLVVLKTGSIISAMIVHFMNNFIVILINYICTASGVSLNVNIPLWLLFLLGLAALSVMVGVLIPLFLNLKGKRKFEIVKFKDKSFNIFMYLGMLVCCLFFILNLFM